jgi:hypothetical protein
VRSLLLRAFSLPLLRKERTNYRRTQNNQKSHYTTKNNGKDKSKNNNYKLKS